CNPEFVRNIMLKQFYKNVKVFPETGYRPMYTRADTLRGALRPERTCFNVHFYDLNVRIIPASKRIKAANSIYFEVVHPTKRIQIDLFDNFEITGITWNGKQLKWFREYNAIFIDFPEELKAGDNHMINIAYGGKPLVAPNPPWDGGFVWKKDKNKDLWLGVACEQLGASSWWPTKDHLSDKPDSMQIRLEVPSKYKAVSNGDLKKTEKLNDNYTAFTWFVEYPINNYNATFYVGNYVAFSDTLVQGSDSLKLDYNVLAYSLDTAKRHFKQSNEVLEFYNRAFGFFPFAKDGFGLVESPYEGMEHQTAIAYGHGYSKNTLQDYRNKFYDYIIVHEAAHEWWGNSVTAADMADVWIHEGFATYAEYMFLEDRLGKDDYYYELTQNSRYIFNVWPMVQNRNVNEDAFASNDVYNKGAMLLHCLRCNINNDSVFFGLIHDFCTEYRYRTVSSNDFITFTNNYTGTDYTGFFNKFLLDTRLPVLEYSFRQTGDDLLIKYRWSETEDGFIMPFGIETDKGKGIRLLATSSWQETLLKNTNWFNFYNLWKGYQGCPDNSYTYYHTNYVN
ncbi:MAG TPA: M1 family metallopeptidase, partial [Bacteroidales bacterium]|nr:M1 family metallopeptidase [Bacteroidales bacterium]